MNQVSVLKKNKETKIWLCGLSRERSSESLTRKFSRQNIFVLYSAKTDVKNINELYNNNNVDFAVPAGHWVKKKVSENRDKYQDLARELKN